MGGLRKGNSRKIKYKWAREANHRENRRAHSTTVGAAGFKCRVAERQGVAYGSGRMLPVAVPATRSGHHGLDWPPLLLDHVDAEGHVETPY